jgi:sialate O-acetylesterase
MRTILATLLLATAAFADVRLPSLIADHMVIQRGLPVHVWGMASPGESVSVNFRTNNRSTAADELGRWSLYLDPGDAGGPFDLTIKGNNTITVHDVLVGDIWVASGQSNMEWPLDHVQNAQAEIAAANNPRIRLFHVKNKSAYFPLEDVESDTWVEVRPDTAAKFSAVAYFFGRQLSEKIGVPIGLISTNWGGTPADTWTSLRGLSSDPGLMPVFAEWDEMNSGHATTLLRREKQMKEYEEAKAKAKADGKPEPPYPWMPNLDNSWMPAGLFNAMIAPLTKLPIKGAIWYQGESNAGNDRAPLYNRLFTTMIKDWRRAWGVGDFPFLFVQLANFKTGGAWPELREAQLQTLSLVNTGMAVVIDIGNPDDIHPRNKQDVGLRLSVAARAIAYGEKIEYSGPLYRLAVPEGSTLRVYFDHADGLMAKGAAPQTFEIAGADGKFVAAEAHIDGKTVVVSSPAISAPVLVRYGWSDNPACNLYNGAGLPASPFRSTR